MKYSLRSLFVVITLAGVVFSRVGYLKSRADFHSREYNRLMRYPVDLLGRDAYFHWANQLAYERAMWRPWTIVDEDDVGAWNNPLRLRRSLPSSSALAPNPKP
jgi:hypothetical protein